MNMLRIGNEKVSEVNQYQKQIDWAKKNCQIVLDPNVPEFLPRKAAFYVKNKFVQVSYPVFKPGQKFPTYRAFLVDHLPEEDNFGIIPGVDAFKELESKFVQEAKEVCQYCLVNTNNHFRGSNCLPRTNLSTTGSGGYDSSVHGFRWLLLSSDEEYLTPTKSVQRKWSEDREVAATEEFYRQTYFRNKQNQIENVWLESKNDDFSLATHISPGLWMEMNMTRQITEDSCNQTTINSNHMDNVWLESNPEDFSARIWVKDLIFFQYYPFQYIQCMCKRKYLYIPFTYLGKYNCLAKYDVSICPLFNILRKDR